MHRILIKNKTIIIEEMQNLDKVLERRPRRRTYFIYDRIGIQNAEGVFVRQSH